MLGQANIWSQAKTFFGGEGGNFEAKIEARPTTRPGQANGARPGFIVCLQKYARPFWTDWDLVLCWKVNITYKCFSVNVMWSLKP